VAPQAGRRGSDNSPGMAAFCGLSAPMNAVKKNVPTWRLGGGRGIVVKPSSVIGLRGSRAPSWHTRRGWSSGRGHSSVRGRRVRPPQVGVRRGPGASISEAAQSPIEQARPVTAEGLSMSPLPRVPAGRFRRSGTRDLAGARRSVRRIPEFSGTSRRRSDAGRGASGGATAIIGSTPPFGPLRPRHRRAHPTRAASESRCRPATSGA
jgi:hypothetical protein